MTLGSPALYLLCLRRALLRSHRLLGFVRRIPVGRFRLRQLLGICGQWRIRFNTRCCYRRGPMERGVFVLRLPEIDRNEPVRQLNTVELLPQGLYHVFPLEVRRQTLPWIATYAMLGV